MIVNDMLNNSCIYVECFRYASCVFGVGQTPPTYMTVEVDDVEEIDLERCDSKIICHNFSKTSRSRTRTKSVCGLKYALSVSDVVLVTKRPAHEYVQC